MGHALGNQAVNKKVAGNLCLHGRYCAAVITRTQMIERIITKPVPMREVT